MTVLQAWTEQDGAFYAGQVADPEIQRFTVDSPDTTADDVASAIRALHADPHGQFGRVIVDPVTGDLCGNLALERSAAEVTVSYWVAAHARGRGLARRAVREALDWVRSHWSGTSTAFASIHADNAASAAVVSALGFERAPQRDKQIHVRGEDWPMHGWQLRLAPLTPDEHGGSELDGDYLDQLWDFNDPAESEGRLRRARDDAADGVRDELTTQVARALGLQEQFDAGWAELALVESDGPVVRLRRALESGRLARSAGDTDRATESFLEATRVTDTGHDFLRIDALHMLAITDGPHAEQWTAAGLELATTTSDQRAKRWVGSLMLNAGWAHHDAGRHAQALESFERAVAAYAERGAPEQLHAARWAVARCLRSLGRDAEALAIQEQLALAEPTDTYVQQELAILNAVGTTGDSAPPNREKSR
ncbi:GNAT family N-acetyltransferase [Luteipulveratus mongoliensis]|uniref:GNAT family N-acetyltransferase n=1 Tax=Luteipulveratus mongoliensis TaxID=571913 RepID=UPI0009FA79BC|nr:GNAT family N-acetyltransferase [Luteipulveratus mongoliensis]